MKKFKVEASGPNGMVQVYSRKDIKSGDWRIIYKFVHTDGTVYLTTYKPDLLDYVLGVYNEKVLEVIDHGN